MKKTLTAAVMALTLAFSLSACGEDEPAPVTKSERDQATAAALDAAGEGSKVAGVERAEKDDAYAFEVEVVFDNGSELDLELDKDFKVLNPPPKG